MGDFVKDINVPGVLESGYIENLRNKEQLRKREYRIPGSDEIINIATSIPENSWIISLDRWLKECVISIPGEGNFLSQNSIIFNNGMEAFDFHNKKLEFYVKTEEIKNTIKKSLKIPYNGESVLSENIGTNDLTKKLFGINDRNEEAVKTILNNMGIRSINFNLPTEDYLKSLKKYFKEEYNTEWEDYAFVMPIFSSNFFGRLEFNTDTKLNENKPVRLIKTSRKIDEKYFG